MISQGQSAPMPVRGEVSRHWGVTLYEGLGEAVLTHIPSGLAACRGFDVEDMKRCADALDTIDDFAGGPIDQLKATPVEKVMAAMDAFGLFRLRGNWFALKTPADGKPLPWPNKRAAQTKPDGPLSD